jgi:ketosteroid isomerase-like protein
MKQKTMLNLAYYPFLLCLLLSTLVHRTDAQSTSNAHEPTFSIETARKQIAKRDHDYEDALRAGDAVALGKLYAIDAELLHSGGPSTVGRANIIKEFERMIRDSITSSEFKTTGLWGNDELLVEQGTGFFAHSSGKWISHGIYLLVWKKVDGEWLIFRDTWFKQPN